MVLNSQMTRTGLTRGRMGGKRGGWRWQWLALLGLVVVLGGGYAWYSSDAGGSVVNDDDVSEGSDDAVRQAMTAQKPSVPTLRFDLPRPSTAAAATPPPVDAMALAPAMPPTPTTPAAVTTATPQVGVTATPPGAATPNTTASTVAAPAPVPGSALPTPPAPGSPMARGMQMVELGKFIEGRQILSDVLTRSGSTLSAGDAQAIRDTLTSVNKTLVFSPQVVPGDPVAEYYTIQSGDLLARLAPRFKLPYQAIEVINNINANRINAGQRIKVLRGPFHAVVKKSEYRMDLYLHTSDGQRLYVRSFRVGLGEADSTPVGSWIVRAGGKVADPAWTNPRTGESFAKGDPKNPIGKFWLAIEGTDDRTKSLRGYGIHGTIDPQSIGTQASMGCVRLADEDIALVYKLLADGQSTVVIEN